jgi:hypothetical protein
MVGRAQHFSSEEEAREFVTSSGWLDTFSRLTKACKLRGWEIVPVKPAKVAQVIPQPAALPLDKDVAAFEAAMGGQNTVGLLSGVQRILERNPHLARFVTLIK